MEEDWQNFNKGKIILSEEDIEDIYSKVYIIEPRKYVPLPPNDKNWRWEKKDFPRVIALLEFAEFIKDYQFEKVLSFNNFNDPEYEYLDFYNSNNYNYPEYDLHNLNLPENDHDFVMLNQTIEHLYNPILALENVYKHLRIGGILYANVPANNVPHDTPFHYYTGITAVGLGAMVKLAGFDIIKIGQWGNKVYFRQMFDNLWSDYTYSKKPGFNDPDCPLITWVFAIK